VTPTLHTGRLLLEPYVPADEDAFAAFFGDARVSRWMGDGPAPEEEYRAMFGRIFTKVYAQELFDVWAVREDGRFVGHAEIKPAKVVDGHEVVYAVAPHAWGRGLGTELARAVTAYGFDALGLPEVHATVAEPNAGSRAVLEKIGYHHVRDIAEDDGATTHLLRCSRS
jgi:RimJ/RimL family protein N-acetyltransferase